MLAHLKIDSVSAAEAICGKLSHPSKMPCPTYNTPAAACKTGSALAKVEGSVCNKCYAKRNNYLWPLVKQQMQFRLESLDHPQWVDAIVYLIRDSGTKWFRWHDSGDIQSLQHLFNIVQVAEKLPKVKFWLPTRERATVLEYLRTSEFPKNLTVRVSAAMIDGQPIGGPFVTSTVHRKKTGVVHGHKCPAHEQGNKCLDCRACWDKKIRNCSYEYH